MPDTPTKSKEQKGAEAEVDSFRKHLGPFVVAAETTRMPMVFTNSGEPGNLIIFANDSLLSLTGYDREDLLGRRFDFLLPPGGTPEALAQLEAAFAEPAGNLLEIACRGKSGVLFWVAIFVGPVRDETGEIVLHFVSFMDLTRHKQAEDHLRFLLDELNHRTQNTLATVQAIAAQTLRGVVNQAALDAFQGRILALSEAHSLLGNEKWLAVSLRDVINRILQPFGVNDLEGKRFSITGEDVRLAPKVALTLAMVFHELATNAVKYGALSDGAGKVEISWRLEPAPDGDRMRLLWRERGGPPVAPPRRKGFGSRLIEGGLAQELNGDVHLDYRPAGLVCRIVAPIPPLASASHE